MDRRSERRDQKEPTVNAKGEKNSDKWKRRLLYGVRPDKPRTEDTLEATQERTSGSRDRLMSYDGRLELAMQHQQAYQFNSNAISKLSSGSISGYRRQGSDIRRKLDDGKSNTSELGERKGSDREQYLRDRLTEAQHQLTSMNRDKENDNNTGRTRIYSNLQASVKELTTKLQQETTKQQQETYKQQYETYKQNHEVHYPR